MHILILGNILKDTYLRLDKQRNHFELDQHDTPWLDLAFDGSTHQFYSRVSIFGGASISLEILENFHHHATIAGYDASFRDGNFQLKNEENLDYRYILCHDNEVSYLASNQISETPWQNTQNETIPDWLYLDRSANLTPELSAKILDFLTQNPQVKLASFITHYHNQDADHVKALIEKTDFLISDTSLQGQSHPNHAKISDHHIEYQNKRVAWSLADHQDIFTKLSAANTIAASLLGAQLLGKDPECMLLLARANLQHSRLGSSNSLENLEELIVNKNYHIRFKKGEETMTPENSPEIERIAAALVAPGKGILAADESGGSIHKKFESMNIPDDEAHRRDYRNLFFTTPELEKYASGVILFDETARQLADDGTDFITFLKNRGVISGIKVDQGLAPLSEYTGDENDADENYTKGLDGLPERLAEYYQLGARFAKWRTAFNFIQNPADGSIKPSDKALKINADILAQYALDCQNANIVPIVEPEFVYDGDYTIEQNAEISSRMLDTLFASLTEKNVNLKGCLLKCNMVLAGKQQARQSTPDEVGAATAEVLKTHVPAELAGVVFLSGGQSVQQATDNLQAVTNHGPYPWPVTFSYARALQDPALQAWQGDNANANAAREAFRQRLIANADALNKK